MTETALTLKQGDLVRWVWKQDRRPTHTHDVYWCKARTAIVLKDGRWVDTYWHSLNDSEHLWSSETEILPDDVEAEFLINTADLVVLSGPRDQYAEADTFHLCNGGGGSWRDYMRKGAVPKADLVRAVLERRLAEEQSNERMAKRRQEDIATQLDDLNTGKDVRL